MKIQTSKIRSLSFKFVAFVLVSTLVACSNFNRASAEQILAPKNVLFLIADDLNNSLGCYQHPIVKSPNIDRLALRGTTFNRAYCTFPLCGPSRNSLLTGLYPNSTGIHQNSQIFRQTIPRQVSLPQAFRHAGYIAGRVGKLYHYNVPNSIGTNGDDDPASWEIETNPAGVDRLVEEPHIKTLSSGQFGGTVSWLASEHEDAKHTDALEADDAIWILERFAKQRDRPFFLSVGFFRPHTPYVAPRAYYELYDRADLPVASDVAADQADLPEPALASYKKEEDQFTDDLRREALQGYYASISFMDAQVGRVLDALSRLGLEKNTIVVFTSDHGYHTGEHGLWQKMSLFEESARVPLLISVPGVSQPGSTVNTPVSLVDLYPTLLELSQVNGPKNLQGQSLVPMLEDTSEAGRGWAITQVTRGSPQDRYFGYSLRTSRWRYTEWDHEGTRGRELYDHDIDHLERNNLIGVKAMAKQAEALSIQLRDAIKITFPDSLKTPLLNKEAWPPSLREAD